MENLLRAANVIESSRNVTDAQVQLAVAYVLSLSLSLSLSLLKTNPKTLYRYAAIKKMRKSKLNQDKRREALTKIGHFSTKEEEDDGEENTICVRFSGRSCVFNISTQTKFIHVLRQACEYWSMSCTGVLLVDHNQNAYPLNDTIVSCPGGVRYISRLIRTTHSNDSLERLTRRIQNENVL